MISYEFNALKELDSANAELRQRNQERVEAMKQAMGKKFVLHPANAPRKHREKKVLK